MAERYCRVGSDKEALKNDGGSERERGERKKRRTAARSPEGRKKKKKTLAPVLAEMK